VGSGEGAEEEGGDAAGLDGVGSFGEEGIEAGEGVRADVGMEIGPATEGEVLDGGQEAFGPWGGEEVDKFEQGEVVLGREGVQGESAVEEALEDRVEGGVHIHTNTVPRVGGLASGKFGNCLDSR